MNKVKGLFLTVLAACLTLLPGLASAAGGGAAPIVIVSDTRRVADSAILTWWGNLYNESHLQFTIMTCVLIPVTGILFGVLADVFFAAIGVNLSKRDLAEH